MMARTMRRWRRFFAAFWAQIDSETVGLLQSVGAAAWCICGIYNLAIADAHRPQVIESAIGEGFYQAWLWALIVGPLVCIIGKRLGATYTGCLLQLSGDSIVTGVFSLYIGAAADATWGDANVGVFAVMICWLAGILFVTRDFRRILQAERQVHRDKS